MVKGEVSTRLTAALSEPYLRYCVPCQAVAFVGDSRSGSARCTAGWSSSRGPHRRSCAGSRVGPDGRPGPAEDPLAAPEHLQPIRNYLRFLGPATPNDVAAFLDAPVAEIKAHWPDDAIEVTGGRQTQVAVRDGAARTILIRTWLRLLGSHDLFLQARDRALIVPDKSRHKALWPVIGRPGAVLSGVEIIGTWRPKASGSKLHPAARSVGQDRARRSAVGSRPKPSGSRPIAASTLAAYRDRD